MAGGKLSPRQQMINMMYLVLTALLAMNVSKDILDAFVIINNGIEITNVNFEGKNETTYNLFDKAKMNDPLKVTEYWQKAQQAKTLADELDNHMESLKQFLVVKTDGRDSTEVFTYANDLQAKINSAATDEERRAFTLELDSLFDLKFVGSKDNYDIPTNIMIGDPGNLKTGPLSANELKLKIGHFRKNLIDLLDLLEPTQRKKMEEALSVSLDTADFGVVNGTYETWESGYYYHIPLAAVITQLSKMQSDVRNAEADVIKSLYGQISADDFKFDTLAAKVIPNTNYVIIGDSYKADVFVAAFSTTQNPVLDVGEIDTTTGNVRNPDTASVSYSRGVAKYFMVPKSEGPQEWGGIIKIKKPDGGYKGYPFKSEFISAKPTVVVSPTAMNVFYRGLDNPVEVSVPGFAAEELKVAITNGSMSGSKGKYTIRPGNGKTTIVTVTAEKGGKTFRFGQGKEFRCKNVPDPKPKFAGIQGSGNVQKKQILSAQGVIAEMENFEFDLKFNVISYTMSATIKGSVREVDANGARVNGDMKTMMKTLKNGQKLYIEKIKAKGPDGTVRDLGTMVLKVIG